MSTFNALLQYRQQFETIRSMANKLLQTAPQFNEAALDLSQYLIDVPNEEDGWFQLDSYVGTSWYHNGSTAIVTATRGLVNALKLYEGNSLCAALNGSLANLHTQHDDLSGEDRIYCNENLVVTLSEARYEVGVDVSCIPTLADTFGAVASSSDVSAIISYLLEASSQGKLSRGEAEHVLNSIVTSSSETIADFKNAILAGLPNENTNSVNTVNLIQSILGGWTSSNVSQTGSSYSFVTPPVVDCSPLISGEAILGVLRTITIAVGSVLRPVVALAASFAISSVQQLIGKYDYETRNYPVSNSQDYIRSFSAPVFQNTYYRGSHTESRWVELLDAIDDSPNGTIILYSMPLTILCFKSFSDGVVAYNFEGYLTDHMAGFANDESAFFSGISYNATDKKVDIEHREGINDYWLFGSYEYYMRTNQVGANYNMIVEDTAQSLSAMRVLRGIRCSNYMLARYVLNNLYSDVATVRFDVEWFPRWDQDVDPNLTEDSDSLSFIKFFLSDAFRYGMMSDPEGLDDPFSVTNAGALEAWIGLTNKLTYYYRMFFSSDSGYDFLPTLLSGAYDECYLGESPDGIQYRSHAILDDTFNSTTLPPLSKYSAKARLAVAAVIATAAIAGALAVKTMAKRAIRSYIARKNAELFAAQTRYNESPTKQNLNALRKLEQRIALTSRFTGYATPLVKDPNTYSAQNTSFASIYRIITGSTPW